ncbi:DUF504 domain-containing protein [Pyxidicoccus fallax]|uniref:DUF504 domain-containing protein n=1 Tax=Pyxidicoccus fallax TaxID=394095 RepID=A0A848LDG4_9BACT|nr:poly(A) polymerase [Pyxidicoccus fallax]NMO13468.1 DUF504 domain-containing protein [Pyxidicoccus fallax]NPC82709.1 DUF504 domain-containing protein [Pyxidicoccus fallax]
MPLERSTSSREVYHRIRSAPRLDAREFVIGYDAREFLIDHGSRFEQMAELPFEAFVPDGEIPWHRVWYFKRGDQMVWHRTTRIDKLTHLLRSGEEPKPSAEEVAAGTTRGFTSLPGWRFDAGAGAWVEAPASTPLTSLERLTVVTYNVLFDLYDAEWLATERRTLAMLALLRDTGADVIALQEVTPPFLRALLAEAWVREHYWLSEGPGAATVTPYGQVLLSRIPFTALSQRAFSRDKRIIAARLAVDGTPLWVTTQHLTSNRTPEGGAVRASEIETLIQWVRSLDEEDEASSPDVVLAGDFNFDFWSPEDRTFVEANITDAWDALHPRDGEGKTHDPTRNALAARTSRSGRPQRLDRVLVSSPSERLVPEAIALLGEAPLEGPPAPSGDALYLSDHFGVRCVLRRGDALQPEEDTPAPARPRGDTTSLAYDTALVLIPDEPLWEPIQALRRKYDSNFAQWMPHIPLLHPFYPEEHFGEVEAWLVEALRDVKPFDVSLGQYDAFEHGSSVTVWLQPYAQPQGALEALHAKLERALPGCDEQSRLSPKGYTPHLTVGQFPVSRAADVNMSMQRLNGELWHPLDFTVREVCIVRRQGDNPFEVVRRVPLGGTKPRKRSAPKWGRSSPEDEEALLRSALVAHGFETGPATRRARAEAVRQLQGLCARVGAELHPYGAYVLGTDGPDSDVDVVAIGPSHLSREDFAHALLDELPPQDELSARNSCFLADATHPRVKLTLGDVRFEVSYANRPAGVAPCDPAELLALHSDGLDTPGFLALLGVADTRLLLETVARVEGGPERFRELLRAVKAWAKARGIHSHALGYPGDPSWAVMAAWAFTRAPRERAGSVVSLLAFFFETFAAWPWPQPVALTPETAGDRPDGTRELVPVMAPALPARNTVRDMTRSTFRVLREELARARDLVEQARARKTPEAWDALFEPLDITREFPAWLEFTLLGIWLGDFPPFEEWMRGHLSTLLHALEGDGRIFVRPHELPDDSPSLRIGLDVGAAGSPWELVLKPDSFVEQAMERFIATFDERPYTWYGSIRWELHTRSTLSRPGT